MESSNSIIDRKIDDANSVLDNLDSLFSGVPTADSASVAHKLTVGEAVEFFRLDDGTGASLGERLSLLRMAYPHPIDRAFLDYGYRYAKQKYSELLEAPSGNTVLIVQKDELLDAGFGVAVDWGNFVVPLAGGMNVCEVCDRIADLLHDSVWWEWGRTFVKGRVWQHSAFMTSGVKIGYGAIEGFSEDKKQDEFYLSVNGAAWQRCTLEGQITLLSYLWSLGARSTRLDLNIDDYEKRVPVGLVQEAINRHNYTNLRSEPTVQFRSASDYLTGWTYYFGSRQSDHMRFYDKETQSKGERCSHRWECQFVNTVANQHFSNLAEIHSVDSDEFYRLASQYIFHAVTGFITFMERETKIVDGLMERKPVRDSIELSWWANFKLACDGCFRLSPVTVKSSIQRFMNWTESKLGAMFATVYAHDPSSFDEWIDTVVCNGGQKLAAKHQLLLKNVENDVNLLKQKLIEVFACKYPNRMIDSQKVVLAKQVEVLQKQLADWLQPQLELFRTAAF